MRPERPGLSLHTCRLAARGCGRPFRRPHLAPSHAPNPSWHRGPLRRRCAGYGPLTCSRPGSQAGCTWCTGWMEVLTEGTGVGRGEAWGEGDGARGKGGGKGRGRHQQAIHAATGWRRTELTRAGGTGDGDVCTVPEDPLAAAPSARQKPSCTLSPSHNTGPRALRRDGRPPARRPHRRRRMSGRAWQ